MKFLHANRLAKLAAIMPHQRREGVQFPHRLVQADARSFDSASIMFGETPAPTQKSTLLSMRS